MRCEARGDLECMEEAADRAGESVGAELAGALEGIWDIDATFDSVLSTVVFGDVDPGPRFAKRDLLVQALLLLAILVGARI